MKKVVIYAIITLVSAVLYGSFYAEPQEFFLYTLSALPIFGVAVFVFYKIGKGFKENNKMSRFVFYFAGLLSVPMYCLDIENRNKSFFPEFLWYLVFSVVFFYLMYLVVQALYQKASFRVADRKS